MPSLIEQFAPEKETAAIAGVAWIGEVASLHRWLDEAAANLFFGRYLNPPAHELFRESGEAALPKIRDLLSADTPERRAAVLTVERTAVSLVSLITHGYRLKSPKFEPAIQQYALSVAQLATESREGIVSAKCYREYRAASDATLGAIRELLKCYKTIIKVHQEIREGWFEEPTKPNRRQRRFIWMAQAIVIVMEHPERTDTKIAEEVGVNPGQLSRCGAYQLVASSVRGDKTDLPAAHVVIDPDTKERTFDEKWEHRFPEKIVAQKRTNK